MHAGVLYILVSSVKESNLTYCGLTRAANRMMAKVAPQHETRVPCEQAACSTSILAQKCVDLLMQ